MVPTYNQLPCIYGTAKTHNDNISLKKLKFHPIKWPKYLICIFENNKEINNPEKLIISVMIKKIFQMM